MSEIEPEHPREEKPYERIYRHARSNFDFYAARCFTTIQSISQYYLARREAYGGWEQEKKVIAVLTLLFVIAYTLIQARQLSVIRDQERRQLRAYIGPINSTFEVRCPACDRINVTPDKFGISENYVYFKIKNHGSTPAYRLIVCSNLLGVGPKERPQQRRDEYFRGCEYGTIINPTVWPSEEVEERGNIRSVDEIVEVINHKRAEFFFGKIEYDDVWSRHHVSYICRRFETVRGTNNANYLIGCNSITGPQDD